SGPRGALHRLFAGGPRLDGTGNVARRRKGGRHSGAAPGVVSGPGSLDGCLRDDKGDPRGDAVSTDRRRCRARGAAVGPRRTGQWRDCLVRVRDHPATGNAPPLKPALPVKRSEGGSKLVTCSTSASYELAVT